MSLPVPVATASPAVIAVVWAWSACCAGLVAPGGGVCLAPKTASPFRDAPTAGPLRCDESTFFSAELDGAASSPVMVFLPSRPPNNATLFTDPWPRVVSFLPSKCMTCVWELSTATFSRSTPPSPEGRRLNADPFTVATSDGLAGLVSVPLPGTATRPDPTTPMTRPGRHSRGDLPRSCRRSRDFP